MVTLIKEDRALEGNPKHMAEAQQMRIPFLLRENSNQIMERSRDISRLKEHSSNVAFTQINLEEVLRA